MKIVMKVNLGSRDAARYELDFRQCVEGAEIDVSDEFADDLVRRGYAAVHVPAEINAVPDEPEITGVESKPKKKAAS